MAGEIKVDPNVLGAALVEWIERFHWVEERTVGGKKGHYVTYKGIVEMNEKGIDLEKVLERSPE